MGWTPVGIQPYLFCFSSQQQKSMMIWLHAKKFLTLIDISHNTIGI